MQTIPRFTIAILSVLFVFSFAFAQGPAQSTVSQNGPTITAAASGERVRITAPSSVVQMHVEVYAASGEKLFDQEIRGGNVFDWHLQDGQAQRLAPGTYVCLVTAKSVSGKLTQKIGAVNVEEKSVSVQPADSPQLSAPQAQIIGPVEENSSWTIAGKDEPQTPTVIANDGTDGQMIRGRGALTFRIGNFFTGNDKEQMRLTEDGRLGIGTSNPRSTLDVAGTIRAERFLVAKPNTSAGDIKAQAPDAADSVQPVASGSGTQNRIAKWTDNAGTLGDSGITETAGFVGIGTATPTQALEVANGRIIATGSQTLAAPEGILEIGTTVTNNHLQASGIRMRNLFNGTANFQQALDVAPTFAPSASISLARGFISSAFFAPPAGVTITDAYGGNANTVYNNTGGAVTNGAGFAIRTPIVFGALKPTNQYGLRINNQGIGGTTNSYGLFVDAQSGSTNSYSAIFAGGNVGIGTTNPIARLHVAGGDVMFENKWRTESTSVNPGPVPGPPNLIGGFLGTGSGGLTPGNRVTAGVVGATIGGGGFNGSITFPSGGGAFPGDNSNRVTDWFGTVGGGLNNRAGDDDATLDNASFATVSGGRANTASAKYATVGGGINNTASGTDATVGGGEFNIASGDWSTVPGGLLNIAQGKTSFAAGRQALANHQGTFVWADFTPADFASTGDNQFLIRAAGGVGIGTNAPTNPFHVAASFNTTATPANHVALIENTSTGTSPDVLALKIGRTTSPESSNNFITFFKGDDASVGSIEGNGSGGVVLAGPGADYAEWLPRLDAKETIQPGDLVGIFGGRISKATNGASQVMVISSGAIVAGNDPGTNQRATHSLVAFIGQANVRVRGAVQAGDLIVPSGQEDGVGFAVSPEKITAEQFAQVVGQAWETSANAGVKPVRVAVGLMRRDPTVKRLLTHSQQQAAQIAAMEARLEELQQKIEQNAELQQRNTALDARLRLIERTLKNNHRSTRQRR